MKANRLSIAMATSLFSIPALAQPPTGTLGPIEDLGIAVSRLGQRVAALEAAAPTPSVEGRQYCFVLDLVRSIGIGSLGMEITHNSIIRRTATFANGTMVADLDSHVRNIMRDDGTVIQPPASSPVTLTAGYSQVGRKLDITFNEVNAPMATWYVSADGSMISGTAIVVEDGAPPNNNQTTIGTTRHWTLVESEFCDPEGM